MATENKGVIYYKLDPDYHYEGDYTKNCGLNGGEIDGNFHFLRGFDISNFELSKNKGELIVTRFNGDKMSVNLKEQFSGYDFEYDKSEGVLTITMPYGETIDLEGFLTERIFHVYGDYTVEGDGTRYNPMRVSSIARTGTYRPAKAMIDMTNKDAKATLPTANVALNERYVTKEKVSKYGLLYPLTGVDALQKRLQEIGSEWRIPTKADWDQLLNIIEECDCDKNHDSELTNALLGLNAGAYLKSVDQWRPYYRKLEEGEIVLNGERYTLDANGNYVADEKGEYLKVINSDDKYGFAIYPVGFGGRRGVESINGYGEWAAYWTYTEDDKNRDMYVKVFSYDERTVEQNTWGKGCYLSLRLVKDYTGENLYDVETIDGNTVSTKHFIMSNEEDKLKYENTLVWTCENIGFSNPQYGGVVSPEWPDVEGTSFVVRYYVNDWDGTKWVKNEIQEGESIVLFEHGDIKMHEWRIVDGVLIDTLDITKKEIAKDIEAINNRIDVVEENLAQEIADRAAADAEIKDELISIVEREESERIAADDAERAERIAADDAERTEREEADKAEEAERIAADDAEKEARVLADEAERAERVAGDEEIKAELRATAEEINSDIDKLENALEQEVADRIAAVDAERVDRIAADEAEKAERIAADEAERVKREEADEYHLMRIEENELEVDSSLSIKHGDYSLDVQSRTQLKVNLPSVGMIKVDEEGLYIDGNFNFGDDYKINN